MKKFRYSLVALMTLLLFTACVNDSSDLVVLKAIDEVLRSEDVPEIEFNYDSYDTVEPASAIPADDNDYVENTTFDHIVNIAYTDDAVTLTGDIGAVTFAKSGAHLTVFSNSKNISYVLTGSTSNGSFKIYSKNRFSLTLNNVSITNPTGAAINNQGQYGSGGSGTKAMYVVLAEGTTNTLTDGSSYIFAGGEQMKGTIFSEGQVIFSGAGSLTVNGNYKNGIASDDYVVFRPGVNIGVNVSSQGHGIKANDGIYVRGGTLNIAVAGTAGKGMNTDASITIDGGRTTVITSGAPLVESNDTSSCAGLKCDSTLYVRGGVVNLLSTGEGGKGINATGSIEIFGGQLTVVTTGVKGLSAPKGIKCGKSESLLPGDMLITGGSIYCYSTNSSALDIKGILSMAENYLTFSDSGNLFKVKY